MVKSLLKRLGKTLALLVVGLSFISMAIFFGALSGITWLKPYANTIVQWMDALNTGMFVALGLAILGLTFLAAALRILFGRSKPEA